MPSAEALAALDARLEAALARIPAALAEVSPEARSAHALVDAAIALEAARALVEEASADPSLGASAYLYAATALADDGALAGAPALRDEVLRTRIAP